MTNYEVAVVHMPINPQQVQQFEAWLEKISNNGGELVSTMPTFWNNQNSIMCIFRVLTKGSLPNFN